MSRLTRLFATVTLLAALFAGSALTRVAPQAEATGSFQCNGVINVTVSCTNSGGLVNIELSHISILNGASVSVLDIQNVLNNLTITIGDVHVIDDIYAALLNINVQVCQIKVVEIGGVNLNIAKC